MNTDASEFPELTERQERILALIVKEYTNKPEPVGSKFLAEHFMTNVSSATIRNDMSQLEELGLLAAPHTSAGRVPTEAGYRYFVKRLLAETERERELTAVERRHIATQFRQTHRDLENWLRLAVVTLAQTVRGAAVATPPLAVVSRHSQYKHLALISVQGRRVMMVLVLHNGTVRQQMLTLADALSQEMLTLTANRLNDLCDGLSSEQIRTALHGVDSALEHEVMELVADILDEVDHAPKSVLPIPYREGLTDVLREFPQGEGAEQALRLVEERTLLHSIIAEALDEAIGQVRVVVAGDGRWDEVRHLGLVLSRYGVRNKITGTLVVLGPTRMRYGRAISAVGYVSGLMSSMISDFYGAEDESEERPGDSQSDEG